MDKRIPKAAGKPDRANHGRWKWLVWLVGSALVITIGAALPAVGIGASTADTPSTVPEGAAVHSTAGPDTPVQKRPQAQPEPDDLDTFTPSETIEADQGVDFPYDI